MAQEEQNTSSGQVRSFDKALNEDVNDFHLPNNSWTQARNAINNSVTGDLGKLGNEPANSECIRLSYPFATIIGFIHIIEDKWAVYSTDGGSTSEIGLFKEETCKYDVLVNDSCLNFNLSNLIIGVSKATSTCTYVVYWDDGLNPSRFMEFNADYIDTDLLNPNVYTNPNSTIPWVQNCTINGNCNICINTSALDCDKLRLAQFINPICPRVEKGLGGGNLLNGSYFVAMAYAIKNQKISEWYVSNVQGLFTHNNVASALDVYIDSVDKRYDEIIVLVVSVINQQTVARQAGIYSTRQTKLSFDIIQDTWIIYPIEQLPITNPVVNKTDAMYNVGDYLIRVGTTSKEDFNYQPLANQIVAKWQSVQYPADYYSKGNNKVGYMRDEVYAFFIQWIYDTGDKSASYHIPGRPAFPSDRTSVMGDSNQIFSETERWEVYNTASQTATPGTVLSDGGVVIAEGYMGYWESTEIYPDNKPQIWDASEHCWSTLTPSLSGCSTPAPPIPYGTTSLTWPTDFNLCGDKIRHHKFPEDTLNSNTTLFGSGSGNTIRIMGVKFENIRAPRTNDGDIIPGIIGYQILRSSRNGNRSIVAKGIINNMGSYSIPNSTKTGLYPNYPYNDLRADPFLSQSPTGTNFVGGTIFGASSLWGGNNYLRNYFTFHSPETNFNNPFLSTKELKIYGNVYGDVSGKYDLSEKHPKHKILNNISFILSGIVGIGIAALAANGKRQVTYNNPVIPGFSQDPTQAWSGTGAFASGAGTIVPTPLPTPGFMGAQPSIIDIPLIIPAENAINIAQLAYQTSQSTGLFIISSAFAGQDSTNFPGTGLKSTSITKQTAATVGGTSFTKPGNTVVQEDGYIQNLGPLATGFSIPMFLNYWQDGTDSVLRFIKSMLRYRDYAVRYHSHGFYNNFDINNGIVVRPVSHRFNVNNQQYIDPELLEVDSTYRINNLYRTRTTVINTIQNVTDPFVNDKTRYVGSSITSSTTGLPIAEIEDLVNTTITGSNTGGGQVCSSHYTALKVRIRNQYSQLNNIIQLPTDPCYTNVEFDSSGNIIPDFGDYTKVIFGGDTYINRYTEKNTFFYFYDWLFGEPDGTQLNYDQYKMVPYPKYWANLNDFQTSDFTTSAFSTLISLTPGSGTVNVPSNFYALDGPSIGFTISNFLTGITDALLFDKRGWFYLFSSGVMDFFVESEINTAYRDYGDTPGQRIYEPYSGGDSKTLFDTSIIKSGNYYKYDPSLSVSKLFSNYISWASMQSPTYDPYIAETCFVYQPKRVIYSLPNQFENLRDGWKIYLANNYYNFLNVVTCIKPINKSGAVIFFDSASPVQFQGTDQLQTELGTKLTIGDGGLFSQPLQAVINVESSHEYGSCQNRLSVINTPAGVYWMSQNQGKIFTLTGSGIKEVSNINMKWWFSSYLPYKITESFPNFELLDNPVIGVACQSVYDNENGLLYFCKKDYALKPEFTPSYSLTDNGDIYYDGNNNFIIRSTGYIIELGNPLSPWDLYFDDASWTTSFDPKTDNWLSYHDWHPNFCLPGKNTFMTVNPTDRNSIWIHNKRCDLYCNYYEKDYPFEIEFTVNTIQEVTSLRSVQYIMECYKYAANCYDRFHVLDFNFDEATIYNTEQTSGLLKLVSNPKENPAAILQYPLINPTNINVLFSKEENKYRFNQFWDVTDDRGEFYNPTIPGFAERPVWDTQPNGYVRLLNANNLNYNKGPLQRKKFRHYTVSILLRKLISGNRKMLVMLADVKNLISPR